LGVESYENKFMDKGLIDRVLHEERIFRTDPNNVYAFQRRCAAFCASMTGSAFSILNFGRSDPPSALPSTPTASGSLIPFYLCKKNGPRENVGFARN
jgi:hypothetical protein